MLEKGKISAFRHDFAPLLRLLDASRAAAPAAADCGHAKKGASANEAA